MTNNINHIKWIKNEWKSHKAYVFILLFLTLLSTAVAVAYPFLFRQLIDSLEKSLSTPGQINPMSPVHKIVLIMLIVGFVRVISSFYPGFRAYMNLLFEYVLRHRYFKYIIEKDYRFFLKFRTGDLVTRLTNDIQDFPKIGWFLCSGIFRAFDSFIKILFCLVVMFLLSWKLTLLAMLPIPFMIVVFYIVSNKLHKSFEKNQEAISEINNQLEMTFSGIKIIKAFVCEEKYKRFFSKALDNRFITELKLVKINTVLHLVYEYIDYFSMISIILFGGYMVVKGEITIGTFYAFYTYLSMLIYPILDLPQLFVSGRQAFVCIDRLEEIKNFPVISYKSEVKKYIKNINNIRFENVSFTYDDRNVKILDDISFKITKGQKVLILGSSGSGKSTILGLLSGLLIPQNGQIYINDIPISEIQTDNLREFIGYVPQEPSLFSGTIQENILFGKEMNDIDEYETIINTVQMKDEIIQFLDKDQTLLGQKGLSISGGQKQRLAIARALFKKPQVLILDDITASLDAKKEELLWEQISKLFQDLTAFIVSHRLSSLRYADEVILLDSGKISAYGKHEQLIKEHPQYKEFIQHHYKT
ncbi:MAG: ABC transporter ATP-binding protein [Candidatus Cloacimonetes bacterium]|nr:ABC transporter ATP-binding protein [Candidatus Cloacimonadota bacterium]